jgi:hypothetical protein
METVGSTGPKPDAENGTTEPVTLAASDIPATVPRTWIR